MPKQIWNQGRVVGYSAYELYVKQQQSIDPDSEPATERQWLSASLAMGASMLLKIDADKNHKDNESWTKDFQFPTNSSLCSANTIVANFFRGQGIYKDSWATRVSDYGPLISNTAQSSPSGAIAHDGKVPTKDDVATNWTSDEKKELVQYMKIIDGVVIQPGAWSDSVNKPPEKDFEPNLKDYPRIRLLFKGPIEVPFQILLTGFTIKAVVQGEVGLDSATNTLYPQDGDFLGPGQFPWASKIVFSVPTSYIAYFDSGAYTRKVPDTAPDFISVNDSNVIDMKATKPETYYKTNHQNARVQTDVQEFTTLDDGTAVLTVYQKKDKYPPALYATFVESTGVNYLNPLDVVAPGTVKMFEDATAEDLKDYEDTFEGTFGMNKDSEDGTIETLGPDGQLTPVADVDSVDIKYTNPGGSAKKAKASVVETGKKSVKSISVSDGTPGADYTITADGTSTKYSKGNTIATVGDKAKITISTGNIGWDALLEALANDKTIDILGNYLKLLKEGLSTETYPYIQFANGLRFYISGTKPPETNVPEGSIGIGWGFYEE